MHVAASQSIWCFICKWCSAMWLLTSPFLVAGLRSVSRVLTFLCRCRPSYTVLLFILAGKTTQYVYIILDSFSCQYEKQYSTRWKATAKNWNKSFTNKHRTSVGREGLMPKSQSLLVNVYFRLGSAQGSTPRSWSFTCYGVNSCSHWAKSGRNLSDMWRFTISTSASRYRNRAENTTLMCEQKPFLSVLFSCRPKSYAVYSVIIASFSSYN